MLDNILLVIGLNLQKHILLVILHGLIMVSGVTVQVFIYSHTSRSYCYVCFTGNKGFTRALLWFFIRAEVS